MLIFAFAGILVSWNLAAESLIHVVSRGETIYSIARLHGVAPREIISLNNISDPSRLHVGRRLAIPQSASSNVPAVAAPAAPPALGYHHVVRGDTLFSIARTNGITLQNLLDINNFAPNHMIRAGDVIRVPAPATAQRPQAPVQTPVSPPVPLPSENIRRNIPDSSLLALRWPINARSVSHMIGQTGVVIEGVVNEPIRSLTSGKVVSAGPWRRFGKIAIIESAGGYLYMYGGSGTLSVSVGDRVSVGTELGRLGIDAASGRPQLFFMVFRGNTPIDPARATRSGGNLNI